MTAAYSETTMSAALSRAGMNTAESRLRMAADAAMSKHHNNIERAAKTFLAEADALGLLKEMAAAYLKMYRLPDADQKLRGFQMGIVSARQINGDADHNHADHHASGAASSPRGGAGHTPSDVHARLARPVREPSAQERAASRAVSKQLAATVLDSFKIRDGRSIGDVRFGELERLRTSNAMEASVIRQIQKHAVADHDARVRDVVRPDDLNRMIQKAAEVADAA